MNSSGYWFSAVQNFKYLDYSSCQVIEVELILFKIYFRATESDGGWLTTEGEKPWAPLLLYHAFMFNNHLESLDCVPLTRCWPLQWLSCFDFCFQDSVTRTKWIQKTLKQQRGRLQWKGLNSWAVQHQLKPLSKKCQERWENYYLDCKAGTLFFFIQESGECNRETWPCEGTGEKERPFHPPIPPPSPLLPSSPTHSLM